jgi:hypothetical protein
LLGLATNRQLLNELIVRCELDGLMTELHALRDVRRIMPEHNLAYRTVDSDSSGSTEPDPVIEKDRSYD